MVRKWMFVRNLKKKKLNKGQNRGMNMKNLIVVICLTLFFVSVFSTNVFAGAPVYSINSVGFDVNGVPSGMFCNVDKAEVCIITRNEEDCTKLNGVKVDSCPLVEKIVK